MYFLTAQDPNYTIKGSRDPLGMQVLWQAAGRKLIPNLSTVSSNIIDFQILSLAHYLKRKRKIDDSAFESFFLRFEQLMAFVRHQKNSKEGFNGVDRVRKIMAAGKREVMVSNKTEILSNQKAYGIWGKYNRPFSDMGITENPAFTQIMESKISTVPGLSKLVDRLLKKSINEVTYIRKVDLEQFYPLIEKPCGDEQNLFIQNLLQDDCENGLLSEIHSNKSLLNMGLYEFKSQIAHTNNEELNRILDQICRTEYILSPLNRIFRYLQTKSPWKIAELEQDAFIESWRTRVNSNDLDSSVQALNKLMDLTNLELVKGLVKRNEEVTGKRNSGPWMSLTEKYLFINHSEGAVIDENYNPLANHDNTYFIGSYLNLYKQLH